MQKNIIRKAKPEEAAVLSELALRSKGHWGYAQDFLERCRLELTYNKNQLRSSRYCVAVVEGDCHKIAGFYALHFLLDDQPELEALFIDPKYLGRGMGKQLLNAAKAAAKLRQATHISIQSDPFAEDFYLANGAVKVGETESNSVSGRFLPQLQICL